MNEIRSSDDQLLETAGLWPGREEAGSVEVLLAVSSLERTTKIVNHNMEALLQPFSISFARFTLLSALYWTKGGALTLGEVATRLLLHPTSVTSAIDKLERDEFVKRVAHPTDRRATLARITPQGRKLVRLATPHLIAANFGFGNTNVDKLIRLTLLLRNVREAAGDPVASESEYKRVLANGVNDTQITD